MLTAGIDRISSLFAPGFFIAYVGPAVVGFGAAASIVSLLVGSDGISTWWADRSTDEKIAFGGSALVGVIAIALILQSLTGLIVQLFEGYWSWEWLATIAEDWQRERRPGGWPHVDSLKYPKLAKDTMPTGLGNVLRAAEDEPYQLYKIDTGIWWPRLSVLLPPGHVAQLQGPVTFMVALLNLSAVIGVVAVVGGGFVLVLDDRWPIFVGLFLGGLLAAWLCYSAAVSQARMYGEAFRTAFDLHRHLILNQMRIPLPRSLSAEMSLWLALNERYHEYNFPWDTVEFSSSQSRILRDPFLYVTAPWKKK